MIRCLLLAVVLVIAVASDASACSCAREHPRVKLSRADAAFVGTLEAIGEAPGAGPSGQRSLTFRVESALKGRLGAAVEVTTAVSSASCGLSARVGERTGLVLRRVGGHWEAGMCDVVSPGELERAARPYPTPPRRAHARLLVAGRFGDAGLVALDGDGRLAGYAFDTEGDAVSVCPGGRFAVQGGDALHVVRLRDLRAVRRVPLPGDAAAGVRCLADDGADVAALTFRYGGASERQSLLRVRGSRLRRLRHESVFAAALGSGRALLVEGEPARRLVSVDLARGAARRVAGLATAVPSLALSPDDRRAALLTDTGRRSRLFVIDLMTGRRVQRRLGQVTGPLTWIGARRLALGPALYDQSLRSSGRLPVSLGFSTAAAGSTIWTLRPDMGLALRRLRLPDGPAATLDAFDLAGARSVVALPEEVAVVGAERRAPSPLVEARGAVTGCPGGRDAPPEAGSSP